MQRQFEPKALHAVSSMQSLLQTPPTQTARNPEAVGQSLALVQGKLQA